MRRYLVAQAADDWIGALIESRYLDEPEQWLAESHFAVHPSASGSKCVRSYQLGLLGHRIPELGSSTRRMQNGVWTHQRWNAFFKDHADVWGVEQRLEFPLTVDGVTFDWSGEVDVILKHPDNGELVPLEIKSMASGRFKRILPQRSPIESAKNFFDSERRYAVQLCQYWFAMKQTFSEPVHDRAAFLFENTDTQEIAIRWVQFTPEMVSEAFRVGVLGYSELRNGTLLPPPFKRTSANCKGCHRQGVCFALQDGDPAVTEIVAERIRKVSRG